MVGSLEVTCRNVGETRFCGEARGHTSFCDVVPEMGGTDSAMLPPESLLASLGNCLGLAIALTCKSKGIPYDGMEVKVTADLVEDGTRVDNFRAEVKMPGSLDDRQRKIIESAKNLCKVGHTLAHGAKVEEVVL
ncbi:MAG: OsmC family protein [Armatimonadetes bacterium]|nr:OsmC family protein [Armatimonadota bacterium]